VSEPAWSGAFPRRGAPAPGRLTRRLASVTLLGQAMTVFFGALVARQLELAAGGSAGRADAYFVGGCVLALFCVLVSGLLRRRAGIWLGWLAQVLTLASALVLPAMAVVAVIFGVLWWLCLTQGHRMDELTARRTTDAPKDD
jgi:Protein of unknown function (DUF4233)